MNNPTPSTLLICEAIDTAAYAPFTANLAQLEAMLDRLCRGYARGRHDVREYRRGDWVALRKLTRVCQGELRAAFAVGGAV